MKKQTKKKTTVRKTKSKSARKKGAQPKSAKKSPNLSGLRKKIDSCDSKIIDLLNQRTECVIEVGKKKDHTGSAVYAPERESQIYRKIEALAKDSAMPKAGIKAIYREIMSASIALERGITVSYLGPEATYTHLASLSKFGSSVDYRPAGSFFDVFKDVEHDRTDYGVIPVENSIEGAVTHALDMFIDSDLKIISEIYFGISHHLMANVPLKKIKKVYSNPQVFGQCRMWIERHLHHAQLIDTSSTAAAAKHVKTEKTSAAIGSALAAKLYKLPVLAKGIQDISQNVTRFIVVAKDMPAPSGKDKTSILVSMRDKVGALHEVVACFRKYKINMTKIESRPSKKKAWEYYFFIDFDGHVDNPKIKKLLSEVEKGARFLKVLGSYPSVKEISA